MPDSWEFWKGLRWDWIQKQIQTVLSPLLAQGPWGNDAETLLRCSQAVHASLDSKEILPGFASLPTTPGTEWSLLFTLENGPNPVLLQACCEDAKKRAKLEKLRFRSDG